MGQANQTGFGEQDFQSEADADRRYQSDHQCFEKTKALLLQKKNDQDIQRCEAYAQEKRDVKDQIESDRGADNLRQIAGGDGNLSRTPQDKIYGAAEMIPTSRSQVASGNYTQFDSQAL